MNARQRFSVLTFLTVGLFITNSVAGATTAPNLGAVTTAVNAGLKLTSAPAGLRQLVAKAPSDTFNQYDAACAQFRGSCNFGNLKSTKALYVFGDSHAQEWLPALVGAFGATYKITILFRYQCEPASVAVINPSTGVPDPNCAAWRSTSLSAIVNAKPAIVIVAESTFQVASAPGVPVTDATWRSGLATTLTALKASKAKVVMLGDNAAFPVHPLSCLAAHFTAVQSCTLTLANVSAANHVLTSAEMNAALDAGVSFVPTQQWFCSATKCPATIGGMVPYFDWNHITLSYAKYLTNVVKTDVTTAIK